MELDKEAYRFLEMCNGYLNKFQIQKRLSKEFKKDFREREMNSLVRRLMDIRIIYGNHERVSKDMDLVSFDNWLSLGYLTAPETVHWAVTYQCNLNCPHCYVERDLIRKEMDFYEAKEFINILEDIKVFQLAIGGGEPFLRSDLPDIIDYAYEKGIVVNITTNGTCFKRSLLNKIRNKIGCLQISFDQLDISEANRGKDIFDKVKKQIELVKEIGIPFGINLILTKRIIDNLEVIINHFCNLGSSQISLLRPKPSYCNPQWHRDQTPTKKQYYRLVERLNCFMSRCHLITLHIDCALSFFMKDISSQRLKFHGAYGCRAGERFIVVLPNGDIYPCSHFINANNHIGNILKDDFGRLWHNSSVLRRFRRFRKSVLFKKTKCGRCGINEHCGGCRVIAKTKTFNFYKADPDCF